MQEVNTRAMKAKEGKEKKSFDLNKCEERFL